VYWIFYCRTKEKYQGRGLYKASICLLANWAREKDPSARVYIDTSPENIPARRAIRSAGFAPRGVITTLNLQLPKIQFLLWGYWDKNASHPKLPGGQVYDMANQPQESSAP
jgi:RimJ/RimL family protein N-acetyltransferase